MPKNKYYFEGLEVGAVSVKWVRRTNEKVTTEIIRHEGKLKERICDIFTRYNVGDRSRVVITGQSAQSILNLPYYSEVECLEKALDHLKIQPDIIISLGGETFSVYPMKNGIVKNIISSSKCAAGTGEFIVQQFQRMGLTIEEGINASLEGEFTSISFKCSVHTKSDATHKLNKGECKPEDIAKTLINDLARKVSEMVNLAQWKTNIIVLSGGVSLNKVFVEELQNIFSDSHVMVLPESPYLEVFGASLFATEINGSFPPRNTWFKHTDVKFTTMQPLTDVEDLLDYQVDLHSDRILQPLASYILGIDAGSTTTKAVLLNKDNGSIDATVYLRTLGNPITATKNCLIELLTQIGIIPIQIVQCGVTGSAREMVSVFLDGCKTFNEILAHARAATEIVPEVDTVFEIGGQDSKFISFLEGVPIDYAMNEGCSAGTGSFLEESASVDMGIQVEKISDVAITSTNPIAFGERCAAFINTDLRNALQQGANQNDVIAGLVYSIADNYISRIVGPRQLGNTILFLGGVALNKSVGLAMAARSHRRVVVPPHPELMGSIGTALMTRDLLREGTIDEISYDLTTLIGGNMEMKNSFRCYACENKCNIQNISIRSKIYPFGGLCSKYRLLRQNNKDIKEGVDLVAFRNNLMFDTFGARHLEHSQGTIGVPMALTTYTLFPLYAKFINELGYNVVLSNASKQDTTKSMGSICYPCELVHKEIDNLLKKNVDYIFLPRVIELEIPDGYLHGYTCPSTTTISDVIYSQFENVHNKILTPHIGVSDQYINMTLIELGKIAKQLGLEREKGIKAAQNAISHYFAFWETYRILGMKELEQLGEEPSVVITGRPYVVYPPNVNIALPRKIVSRGYHNPC